MSARMPTAVRAAGRLAESKVKVSCTAPSFTRCPMPAQAESPLPPPSEPKIAIWCTGDWLSKAQIVARKVGAVALPARYIKPFDDKTLESQRAKAMKIVTLENASVSGGIGEMIGADLKVGWPDEFIPHGSQGELEQKYKLDADSIAEQIRRRFPDLVI